MVSNANAFHLAQSKAVSCASKQVKVEGNKMLKRSVLLTMLLAGFLLLAGSTPASAQVGFGVTVAPAPYAYAPYAYAPYACGPYGPCYAGYPYGYAYPYAGYYGYPYFGVGIYGGYGHGYRGGYGYGGYRGGYGYGGYRGGYGGGVIAHGGGGFGGHAAGGFGGHGGGRR
jgi:hypothetical protein